MPGRSIKGGFEPPLLPRTDDQRQALACYYQVLFNSGDISMAPSDRKDAKSTGNPNFIIAGQVQLRARKRSREM